MQFELRGLKAQGAIKVEVVNTTMAPVSGGTLAHTLDLGPLPAGMYVVRVQAAEGTVLKRLVKE